MATTLSSTILGYVDAAFGTGEQSATSPEIGVVARFRPRRLSDGEIVPLFVSWDISTYRKVLSTTPADATTFTIDAAAKTVTRSAGSFIDENFFVGAVVQSRDWSNGGNNGDFPITALTDTVMTWGSASGLVNEGPTAGTTVSIVYHHPAPPRMVLPRTVCSMVNQGWGTERGANRPAPESDLYIEYEQFRIGVLQEGQIILHHADHDLAGDGTGALNSWVSDYYWGDAPGDFWIGRLADAWSTWEPFFPFKVSNDSLYDNSSILLDIKSAIVNLNLPSQTARLEGDEIGGTLAAFASANNRPFYAVAFEAEEEVTPRTGYTELGEISAGAGANRMTIAAGWHQTAANTAPGASWGTADKAGLIAVEIGESGGPIAATHHTTASSGAQVTSALTASKTPTGNALQLIAAHSLIQSNIAGGPDPVVDPNAPTVSGCGLTWVQVATILYDSSGSANRARLTLFRALGAAPSAGQLTISFAGQQQQRVQWSWSEFSGVDTGGTDGSAAVVQSVTDTVVESPAQPVARTAIGQTKPVTLGHATGVPAVRTNASHWVVSDALDGLQAIDAIWTSPGVDVIADASLSLSDGGFILDTDQGALVCDVQGEKFDGGVYNEEQGAVLGELFDRNGFADVFNGSDLAALTNSVGIHIPADNPGILRDWCEFLLKPKHVPYPAQDGSGYRTWEITDPSGETPDVTYTGTAEIPEIERLHSAPPVTLVRVGYQRQWALLRDLADGATEEVEEPPPTRLYSAWQWAVAEDTSILTTYPNALRLTVESPLYDPTQAQTAADELLAVLKVKRHLWRIRVAKKLLYAWLGSYVRIVYPGFGLESGKTLACVGAEYSLQAPGPAVWLYLWG